MKNILTLEYFSNLNMKLERGSLLVYYLSGLLDKNINEIAKKVKFLGEMMVGR